MVAEIGDLAAWESRTGNIQTVLSYFGTTCTISVDLPGDDGSSYEVYLQAQRVTDGIVVEMVSNEYLPESHHLDETAHAGMMGLGWTEPGVQGPNYSRFVPEDADLGTLAPLLAVSFKLYGIEPGMTWSVVPVEFGDLHPAREVEDGIDLGLLNALEGLSGAALRDVIVDERNCPWEALAEAGLPGNDRLIERLMVYRSDCPVSFLRHSEFHAAALKDPTYPMSVVHEVLANDPTPFEISLLMSRQDLPKLELQRAAVRGARVARWRGGKAGRFLALPIQPPAGLADLAAQQEDEVIGMLRHPRCPEDVGLAHMHSRNARIRYLALRTLIRIGTSLDPVSLRAARDLPFEDDSAASLYAARINDAHARLASGE